MGLFQNIAALWQNRKALDALGNSIVTIKAEAVKDGLHSTEFWLTAGTSVLTVAGIFYPPLGLTAQTAGTIVGGLVALYTVARTLHKANPPQTITITPITPTPTPLP